MSFVDALFASGYDYDKYVGAFMKEESNGVLHTYLNVEDDEWIYEKCDADDNVLATVPFTLN